MAARLLAVGSPDFHSSPSILLTMKTSLPLMTNAVQNRPVSLRNRRRPRHRSSTKASEPVRLIITRAADKPPLILQSPPSYDNGSIARAAVWIIVCIAIGSIVATVACARLS
jgi:hypothetical protein